MSNLPIHCQQLLEVTYIICYKSCSDGVTKFVRQPLHMHNPSLQDNAKLELILNCLMSAILQQPVVIGKLRNTK